MKSVSFQNVMNWLWNPTVAVMRYLINDQLYPYEIKVGHSGVAYIGIKSLIIFYLYGIYE